MPKPERMSPFSFCKFTFFLIIVFVKHERNFCVPKRVECDLQPSPNFGLGSGSDLDEHLGQGLVLAHGLTRVGPNDN